MAQLTVRNLDDEIVVALKRRAARAGRSAEAEHRLILQEALAPRERGDFFEEARARRVKLSEGKATTTEILRRDRGRAGA